MFENFYRLTGKPFQLTPDPGFYYPSGTHRKALSYLSYGLAQGEGFIVITGEIGAGKSTLVAHLMQTVNPAELTVGNIVTSKLDGEEIVHVVARCFGLEVEGHDKATALAEIEAFLHGEARAGRRCLLVVDEAQNLPVAALEELRMLSNFQLGSHPLLQTLLLGQPEFRATLQGSNSLEQLRQRVIATHHLEPMEEAELEPYITHRLKLAGWSGLPAFDQRVFAELYQASGGIPRRINQIANRLLLLGAVEQRNRIDAVMLHAVLKEMSSDTAFPSAAPAPMPRAKPAAETPAPVPSASPEQSEPIIASHMAEPVHAATQVATGIDPAQVETMLADRDAQIAELQQAVVELANQQDSGTSAAIAPEVAALQGKIAELEARLVEQERTVRQTLTMLIEWVEGEFDQSVAA
jgi:general secretion pathway protein A